MVKDEHDRVPPTSVSTLLFYDGRKFLGVVVVDRNEEQGQEWRSIRSTEYKRTLSSPEGCSTRPPTSGGDLNRTQRLSVYGRRGSTSGGTGDRV